MPLLAALAVALCSALILITWSVMGGFLTMLLNSGRSMVGDVSITWPNSGFAHYEELRTRLEKETDVVAATTPMVETFGLVSLPDDRVEAVQIKGIDPVSYAKVVDYEAAVWWKPVKERLKKDEKGEDPRLDPMYKDVLTRVYGDALSMTERNRESGQVEQAAVPGIE